MIAKVVLSHFKRFKDKTADLKPLSILVGENSSGKTTILQAVNLALSSLSGGRLISHDNDKVREAGISASSLPGINIADFRELYYAKKSRDGKSGESRTGAKILLCDDLNNEYELRVTSQFGGYTIRCLSKSEQLLNTPKLHRHIPLFISGFVGLHGVEERSFPAVIKRHLSSFENSN